MRFHGHAGERESLIARWNTRTPSTPRVEVSEAMVRAGCSVMFHYNLRELDAMGIDEKITIQRRIMRQTLEAAIRAGEVRP